MTNEEVQRLLGGYATNSLTEGERKALFEAALDDQELFDALHGEQALKDLLEDEISRAQVRVALAGGGVEAARPWWRRGWTWGLAGGLAVAASTVAVIAIVNRPMVSREEMAMAAAKQPVPAQMAAPAAPRPPSPSEMMARLSRRELEKKVEGRRSPKEELTHQPSDRKDVAAVELSASAPAPPAPEQPVPVGQSQQSALQAENAQKELAQQPQAGSPAPAVRDAIRDQEAAAQARQRANTVGALTGALGGVAGFTTSPAALKSAALPYSIVKRDESGAFSKVDSNAAVHQGDAVRLIVSPTMSGFLNLYERDSNGPWKPVRSLKVTANTPYTVPEQPIEVKEQEQLRLVLSPEQPAVTDAVSKSEASHAKTASKSRAMEDKAATANRALPITVDITLTGGKE